MLLSPFKKKYQKPICTIQKKKKNFIKKGMLVVVVAVALVLYFTLVFGPHCSVAVATMTHS